MEKGFLIFHKSFNDGFPWDQELNPLLLMFGLPPKTCCFELGFVSRRYLLYEQDASDKNVEDIRRRSRSMALNTQIFRWEPAMMNNTLNFGKATSASECKQRCMQVSACRAFQWAAAYTPVVVRSVPLSFTTLEGIFF